MWRSERVITPTEKQVTGARKRKYNEQMADVQIMFTIGGGGEWMCRVPEEEWPGAGDKEVIDAIKLDFQGEWGDRELA